MSIFIYLFRAMFLAVLGTVHQESAQLSSKSAIEPLVIPVSRRNMLTA
jgi:hypothetical protein